MKKYISLILICVILFSLGSCNKDNTDTPQVSEVPDYNLEVGHEKFEDMPVVNSSSSYLGFESESELYDDCDYVVVGMLTDTFTDGVPKKYGLYGQEVQDGSGEMVASFATLRQLTVLDVLKGENVGETITFANPAISGVGDDGTDIIMWLPESSFIQKQNVKYIFYLNESTREDGTYYAVRDQGVINIDGLDENGSRGKYVTEERYDQVKARFGEYFEKYDRSSELTEEQ